MIKAFVVSAVCFGLLWPGAAVGADTHASVSINLSHDHSKVSGRVDSSKKCEATRKVKLYYAFATGTTFTKVASSETRESGKWSIPGPDGTEIPAGKLYVKVPERRGCAGTRSRTIEVKGDLPGSHW